MLLLCTASCETKSALETKSDSDLIRELVTRSMLYLLFDIFCLFYCLVDQELQLLFLFIVVLMVISLLGVPMPTAAPPPSPEMASTGSHFICNCYLLFH